MEIACPSLNPHDISDLSEGSERLDMNQTPWTAKFRHGTRRFLGLSGFWGAANEPTFSTNETRRVLKYKRFAVAEVLFGIDRMRDLLTALGEELTAARQAFDLVVIGGTALLELGLVERQTRDVDVLAIATPEGLVSADPLPGGLADARSRVADRFDVPSNWLNAAPSVPLLDFGIPDGLLSRVESRIYGASLIIRYPGRTDQIYFKLFAMIDKLGKGPHEADLQALRPTPDELLAAARWTRWRVVGRIRIFGRNSALLSL